MYEKTKEKSKAKISLKKMSLETSDIAAEKIAELKRIFPEVFKEGKIDFTTLKQALGELVDDSLEKYGLSWAGKSDCFKAIQTPSIAILKPCPEESVDFDKTGNLIIEGDNLEVLKLLQKSYHGKVKMIYIDPPYNTGNEFVYPDNYQEGLDTYLRLTGQLNGEGFIISSNTDTNGRYHSKWLNMMYPRLFLAGNLLRDDGVIFVSIDDHEVHNLRVIMDEIFGEENFIANIVWQKKYSPQNDATYFSDMHEHILIYAKMAKENKNDNYGWNRKLLPRSDAQNSRYKNPDDDPRGPWKSSDLSVKTYSKSNDYSIITPSGRVVNPPPSRCWVVSKGKFEELRKDNRIWFGEEGNNVPSLKKYLTEVQDGMVPVTWWTRETCGDNQESKQELKSLLHDIDIFFDTPKPVRLIKKILQISTEADDIILDFFAGSGTTAQSVLDLNNEDGSNRKSILIQLPEPTDNAEYPTIAEICKERVRRAINKLNEEAPDDKLTQDRGFKVFKLAQSNFKIWNQSGKLQNAKELAEQLKLFVNPVKPDSRQEDILYELLLT
jgi:adenine-specific DNA-methyltransferase